MSISFRVSTTVFRKWSSATTFWLCRENRRPTRCRPFPERAARKSAPSLPWYSRARATKILWVPELNWAGLPIKPGEGYGGTPLHIPKTWGKKPALAAAKQHQHFAVITEEDVGEVLGFGSYTLPRALAAKLLEEFTGAHRTSCYRALRLNGRFSRHLRAEGRMLSWR